MRVITLPASPAFTLIEVLVAMTIVAIGVAGNYALVTHSMQQHSLGLYQSRATILADSILAELEAGGALNSTNPTRCTSGEAAACTAMAWRQTSLQRWSERTSKQLPNGALSLSVGGASHTTAAVSWRDPWSIHRMRLTFRLDHD